MARVLGKRSAITEKTTRAGIRIPGQMKDEISIALKKDGFTQKQRSGWISQALINLNQLPKEIHIQLIQEEWMEPGNNTAIQIKLNPEASAALREMKDVLRQDTQRRGKEHISAIIRTAIIQGLLNSEKRGVRTPNT